MHYNAFRHTVLPEDLMLNILAARHMMGIIYNANQWDYLNYPKVAFQYIFAITVYKYDVILRHQNDRHAEPRVSSAELMIA